MLAKRTTRTITTTVRAIYMATPTTIAGAIFPSPTHISVVIELDGIRRWQFRWVTEENFTYCLGIFLYHQKFTECISHLAFLSHKKLYLKKLIIVLFYVIRSHLILWALVQFPKINHELSEITCVVYKHVPSEFQIYIPQVSWCKITHCLSLH